MPITTTYLYDKSRPLCKTFFDNNGKPEKTPYPAVYFLSSVEESHNVTSAGLRERFDNMVEHANNGACLFKGKLRHKLDNESRAGKTLSNLETQTLILDIDNLDIGPHDFYENHMSDVHVRGIAETVLSFLPSYFQNVTYIAHASSSMGLQRDKNTVSLHIEFILREPIKPKVLKSYLKLLNFECEQFSKNLSLTANNLALKWPLDICLADNSRMVFIAPPQVTGNLWHDPFEKPEHRFAFVSKEKLTLDIPREHREQAANVSILDARELKTRRELRSLKGLSSDITTRKINRVNFETGKKETQHAYVLNETHNMHLEEVRSSEKFVYFNINGGDSNAYYVHKSDPQFIHNFKGEPLIPFETVDKESYDAFMEKYHDEIVKSGGRVEFHAFRDQTTDKHFALIYSRLTDQIVELNPIDKSNISGWLADNGCVPPDPMNQWDLVFDPSTEAQMYKRQFPQDPSREVTALNQWQPSELYSSAREFSETENDELQIELANSSAKALLDTRCPNISKLLYHVIGNGDEEYEAFINWLSTVLNVRTKLQTAWFFGGEEGTGKGVFYSDVLKPLFREAHTMQLLLENLEDQFTQAALATKLLVCIDEFRIGDSGTAKKTKNKLKSMIAETSGTVRGMRQEARTVNSYYNFVFFTNDPDAMTLSQTDRRFNIAPRQLTPLDKKYTRDEISDMLAEIPNELPLFAEFMRNFPYSEKAARRPFNNSAKQEMRDASMPTSELVLKQLRDGRLETVITGVSSIASSGRADPKVLAPVQNAIRHWVLDAEKKQSCKIILNDVTNLYNLLSGKDLNAMQIGRIAKQFDMQRHFEVSKWDYGEYDNCTNAIAELYNNAQFEIDQFARELNG